jgi:hypothetical protein
MFPTVAGNLSGASCRPIALHALAGLAAGLALIGQPDKQARKRGNMRLQAYGLSASSMRAFLVEELSEPMAVTLRAPLD